MSPEQWQTFDKWPKGLTVDPHPRKDWFCLWWMIRPDQTIVFIEESPFDDFYRCDGRQPAHVMKQRIEAIEQGANRLGHPLENVVWRIMDPGLGETPAIETGRTLQDVMAELGMWFDTRIYRDIDQRVFLTTNRLDQETLVFLPHLQNTIAAMERWVYARRRGETYLNPSQKYAEEYKDGADCVGYTVIFDPRYFESGTGLPPEGLPNMGLDSDGRGAEILGV